MNRVLDLNHSGVCFLREGLVHEAIDSFTCAVKILKDLANDVGADTPKQQLQFARRQSRRRSSQLISSSCTRAKHSNQEAAGVCFVADNPIEIPFDFKPCTQGRNHSWESSVVLFNLALSLHLVGLEKGGNACLGKALRLYKLSKTLITKYLEEQVVDDEENADLNTRLVMSLLNNLGQLCYELGQYRASRTYFECLTNMMDVTSRSSARDLPEDLEALLLNAIILGEPSVAAAA
jgi:hypothetical protein